MDYQEAFVQLKTLLDGTSGEAFEVIKNFANKLQEEVEKGSTEEKQKPEQEKQSESNDAFKKITEKYK